MNCPECNIETYEDECDNSYCSGYGELFDYCPECGWSDDPCENEDEDY